MFILYRTISKEYLKKPKYWFYCIYFLTKKDRQAQFTYSNTSNWTTVHSEDFPQCHSKGCESRKCCFTWGSSAFSRNESQNIFLYSKMLLSLY